MTPTHMFRRQRRLVCLLLAVLALPPARAASQDAADPGAGTSASAVDAGAPNPARPNAAADDPAAACYREAHSHGRDAYVCDLAVQMARDSGAEGSPSRNAALAGSLNNRALVLADDERLEPALEDLDAALALRPDDPGIHANRGNLLLRLGRTTDALGAYDRAVTLAPQDPASYFNRAFGYLALGESAAASDDVAHARALLDGSALSGRPAPAPDGRPDPSGPRRESSEPMPPPRPPTHSAP